MTDDAQLLRRYARDGSEAAFRELVARHVDLAYSTARRKLGGEAAQAFVNRIASLDPESAFAWAQTIRDGSLRHESQAAAARPWLRTAPDAAKAALTDAAWAAADIDGLQKPRVAAFHDVVLTSGEGLVDRSVSFTLATGEADLSATTGLSLEAEVAELHVARATEELAAQQEQAVRTRLDADVQTDRAIRYSIVRPQDQAP